MLSKNSGNPLVAPPGLEALIDEIFETPPQDLADARKFLEWGEKLSQFEPGAVRESFFKHWITSPAHAAALFTDFSLRKNIEEPLSKLFGFCGSVPGWFAANAIAAWCRRNGWGDEYDKQFREFVKPAVQAACIPEAAFTN